MKKLNFGTLLGFVVAVFGLAAQPEYLDLFGAQVAGAITLAGVVLSALKGALFPNAGK